MADDIVILSSLIRLRLLLASACHGWQCVGYDQLHVHSGPLHVYDAWWVQLYGSQPTSPVNRSPN